MVEFFDSIILDGIAKNHASHWIIPKIPYGLENEKKEIKGWHVQRSQDCDWRNNFDEKYQQKMHIKQERTLHISAAIHKSLKGQIRRIKTYRWQNLQKKRKQEIYRLEEALRDII